jgi:uncharacterized paraquat-inducible protein A
MRNKNKNMEETKKHECPHCVRKAQEEARNDEMGLAILIMLMPAMTLTLLSNAGLF